MIFYTAVDSQGHTHWEKTQADARAINKTFDQVDVPTDKPGLHVWLNATQTKIDTLQDQILEGGEGLPDGTTALDNSRDTRGNPGVPPRPEPVESHSAKSVRFEDEFDNMSLATQLHYAARAMENARDQL